jgi:hypothetical protein
MGFLSNIQSFFRMMAPKAVTILFNLISGGSRIALRSVMQLLRATLITRILSCLTILAFDIIDLSRNRISKIQFARNIFLSLLLILFGTLGWNIGARWFAIEILGGLVGAAAIGMASSSLIDKLLNRFIQSDAQCMIAILSKELDGFPEVNRADVLKKVTPVQLKMMYANKDREGFARSLIEKYRV